MTLTEYENLNFGDKVFLSKTIGLYNSRFIGTVGLIRCGEKKFYEGATVKIYGITWANTELNIMCSGMYNWFGEIEFEIKCRKN
jgi:hypothetical protein